MSLQTLLEIPNIKQQTKIPLPAPCGSIQHNDNDLVLNAMPFPLSCSLDDAAHLQVSLLNQPELRDLL